MSRAAVVQEALSWMGTPHIHEARVKGAGVDCGTFLLEIFERAGAIAHVDVEHLPHDFHMHKSEEVYLNHVEQWAHQIDGPAEPGDLVLYKIGCCISHGALVVAWPTIIHAHLGDKWIHNDDLAPIKENK